MYEEEEAPAGKDRLSLRAESFSDLVKRLALVSE
jgi:hypothetical protein